MDRSFVITAALMAAAYVGCSSASTPGAASADAGDAAAQVDTPDATPDDATKPEDRPAPPPALFEPLRGARSLFGARDLSGDGRFDVVVSMIEGGRPVVRLFAGRDAVADVVAAPATTWVGEGPEALQIFAAPADLDGDAHDDLVLYEPGSGRTTAFFGPFAAREYPTAAADLTVDGLAGPSNGMAAIGDVSGDGQPDLVVPGPGTADLACDTHQLPVRVFFGPFARGARRGLEADASFVLGQPCAGDGVVADTDWNRDGVRDLSLATSWGVAIYFGPIQRRGYSLADADVTVTVTSSAATHVGDLNRDGAPDLFAAGNPARIWFGPFARGALPAADVTLTASSRELLASASVVPVDVDGDGADDLVVQSRGIGRGDRLYVLRGPIARGTIDPAAVGAPLRAPAATSVGTRVAVGDLFGDARAETLGLTLPSGGEFTYLTSL